MRGEFSPSDTTLVNHPAGLAGPSNGGNRLIGYLIGANQIGREKEFRCAKLAWLE